MTDALFCHSSSTQMPTRSPHTLPPPQHKHLLYRGHTRAWWGQYGCFYTKQMPSHSLQTLSALQKWLVFTLDNSQVRTGVKASLSGYCSHKEEERMREMPSRCRPASPFKSASVELIRAQEIKMRGWNERLLEIRNLLAVSTAV